MKTEQILQLLNQAVYECNCSYFSLVKENVKLYDQIYSVVKGLSIEKKNEKIIKMINVITNTLEYMRNFTNNQMIEDAYQMSSKL